MEEALRKLRPSRARQRMGCQWRRKRGRAMSLARKIPDAARVRQIAAANPERSVFVSANAGSGKTHVLVQRAIHLLLRGEDPAKIHCNPFNKPAGAKLATRRFYTLPA